MATTSPIAIKTRAKAIFAATYHYPAVPFRSLGRACFAWAMAKAKFEFQHGTDEERADRDALALAERYGNDTWRLQFQLDRLFWGNSTARARELPRYERALKLMQERKPRRATTRHLIAAE